MPEGGSIWELYHGCYLVWQSQTPTAQAGGSGGLSSIPGFVLAAKLLQSNEIA